MIYVDHTDQSQRVISFCTGIGGIERGLKRAGLAIQPVVYVEIEAFACANLVAGMEAGMVDTAPLWTDIKTFPARSFHGKVHGIIGGYPCQPFSQNGKRRGTSDPRHLWPYIKRHIEAIKPLWCLFENVPGHLTCGYEQVKGELEDLGYAVKEGIYSAEECGATIQRERLFIMAFANGGGRWKDWEPRQLWANMPVEPSRNSWFTNEGTLTQESYERWPANHDKPQRGWEAERTLKSCVGVTIDGHNFRNDLLRAIGNSVVEQTAEIAFIDL